jgi:hypothetical protein
MNSSLDGAKDDAVNPGEVVTSSRPRPRFYQFTLEYFATKEELVGRLMTMCALLFCGSAHIRTHLYAWVSDISSCLTGVSG